MKKNQKLNIIVVGYEGKWLLGQLDHIGHLGYLGCFGHLGHLDHLGHFDHSDHSGHSDHFGPQVQHFHGHVWAKVKRKKNSLHLVTLVE